MRARRMSAVSRGGGNRFESVVGRRVRRAAKAVLALLAAMAMLAPGSAFAVDGDQPAVEFNRLADEDTSRKYDESLGDNNSTRYAGRVWNDKTVSSGDMTFTGTTSAGQGSTYTVKRGNSDFLVTYSTLATSQTVIGQHPTDTVFILDFSTSMTWGYSTRHESVAQSQSRIQAMVESVNSAIDTLVHANGQNRIGIAVFNGESTELVPLTLADDILQKGVDNQYLQIYDYNYTAGQDGGRADILSNINRKTTSTGSGTNIQAGLFTGMRMLANSSDTTVDVAGTTVTRIPNVVLMSDGAPTTFSSSENATYYVDGNNRPHTDRITNDTVLDSDQTVDSGSWWSSSSGVAIGSGNNNAPESADGFVTLLMAAYYKNAINAHYYPGGDDSANIYTIGFGTGVQTPSMVAMANLVLDPATHLNQNTGHAQVDAVSEAWHDYMQDGEPIVRAPIGKGNNTTLVNYRVEHPNDGNEPTSLVYPTQAFSADDGDQLNQIFQQIASMITEQAKAPTQTEGSLTSSGYITYTDPIGSYMQIDSVKALLWSGTLFDKVGSQTEGNVTTYTFRTQKDEDTISSPINGNLYSTDIITVRVETDDQTRMQTLTVRIPAAAIPLRVNTITLDNDGGVKSNESNNAYPLRLVYGVSLNNNVIENGVVNTGVVSSDYINDHSSGDGTVRFYTNRYSGDKQTGADGTQTTVGDATVTFEPADDNPFYYVQENIPLYVGDKIEDDGTLSGEQIARGELDANTTYYFQINYYEGTEMAARWVSRPGSQLERLEGSVAPTGIGGQLELQTGSPRLGNLTDLSRAKGQNATGTAAQRLYPTFEPAAGTSDPADGSFCIYLGNNGVLSVPTTQPVTIEAGQALAVVKRLHGNDLSANEADDNNFEFTLTPQATTSADGTTADEAAEKLKPSDDPTDGGTADGILHFRNGDATKDDDGVATDTMHPITVGLAFTAADAGKTFTYEVAEVVPNPKPAGYLFDTTLTHTVTYTVALDNGRLTVKASVDNGPVMELPSSGGNQVPTVTFDNTYVAPVSALPLTGGDATARNLILAGGGILLLAGVAWLLARRHRV